MDRIAEANDVVHEAARLRARIRSENVLLGESFTSSLNPDARFWQQSLSVSAIPWLAEHRVQGEIVFPGAGYVECALEAGEDALGAHQVLLEDVAFEQLMSFGEDQARDVEVMLRDEGPRKSFRISSQVPNAGWVRHASGSIQLLVDPSREKSEAPNAMAARFPTAIDIAGYYEGIRARQVYHGPPFQGIVELHTGEHEALAKIGLPEDVRDEGYVIHPALLDACLHVSAALFSSADAETYIPVGIERLFLYRRPGRHVWVVATKSIKDDTVCHLRVIDEDGTILIAIDGLRLQRIDGVALPAKDSLEGCVYEMVWRKATPLAEPKFAAQGTWIVFADRDGIGDGLAEQLSKLGQRCIRVLSGSSYEVTGPNEIRIDTSNPEEYRRIFKETFGDEGRCEGVVHLSSLDVTPFEQTTTESLSRDLTHATIGATYLTQAIVRHGFRDAPRLFLITRGAQSVNSDDPISVSQAPILGLGKTISIENPELRCTRIDLAPTPDSSEVVRLLSELCGATIEDQIALRPDGRHVARIVPSRFEPNEIENKPLRLELAKGKAFQLEIRRTGVIDRLALYEMHSLVPGPGEVVVAVEAAGLNFRDVLLTLGVIPDDAIGAEQGNPRLGYECAGRVISVGDGVTEFSIGDEVLAFAMRAFASIAKVKIGQCARKPSKLSWEQAATLPTVFMTAYYALHDVGRLEKGDRVLIHAGTGGVGLAAIQYAQHVGAEIFATAGSDSKRDYLRSLGVRNVFDSRSLGFVDEIKHITNGQGVDVVLNSLSGEFIPASFSILRHHGRFLEIGMRDAYESNSIGLRPFLRSLSFSLIDLRALLSERPEKARRIFQDVVSMFESDVFTPLPVTVFPVSRAVEAFQYLAQAKHIGKIAIGMKDIDARIVAEPRRSKTVRSDCTYVITGGLGGLGFSLASWFVEQGARSLVLVGRKGPSDEALVAIRKMEEAGARVHCAQADVSREDAVEKLFSMIRDDMPPIGGIVHAAMVLDDHTVLQQSKESFQKVFAPKVLGAWNLHKSSKKERLDFFVFYSSVGAVLGSPGQSNYTASNVFLDALAIERERLALPAMSIQWGAFGEVGAAVAVHRGKRLAHRGIESFSPSEGNEAFRRLLLHPRPSVCVARLELRQWFEFYPATKNVPIFAEIATKSLARQASSGTSDVRRLLESVDPSSRIERLAKHVADQVGIVMRLDPDGIDRVIPLQNLGVDSLVGLELRNRLELTLDLRLSATIILTYPSVAALTKHLLEKMKIDPQGSVMTTPEGAPETNPDQATEDLDDEAMLALFDEVLEHAEKI